ncbi:tRNA ligase subunit PheS family protein [Cellulomonas phragmiteti]|uniref:Phenylalanyl-tRNA synthetase domain-containing protein n=1 Tax=Cellulomonas phragmiteti TaxID=478780 RepID=A0ABQ4DR21_9CELL|nr:hypothetical protein [Cellulomonas phragmiteti]GIG41800.1 hypothetical protein Cph01nite_35620 [Cellulomonas phragmiteti]
MTGPDGPVLDEGRLRAAVEEVLVEHGPGSPGPHAVPDLRDQLLEHLGGLGFAWQESVQVDDVVHTFDLLGVAADHPTRTTAQSFLLGDGRVLRSHTTSSVLRALAAEPGCPRRRLVVGGPCYRNVRPGPRFVTFFHQVEMCAVGPEIGFGDVKGLALSTVAELLGPHAASALRPRALPYVAPGLAVDVVCTPCDGRGCGLCGGRGQLEVMAGGLLRDEIARDVDVPAASRVALLAVSLERVLAVRHGVADIRPFIADDPPVVAPYR